MQVHGEDQATCVTCSKTFPIFLISLQSLIHADSKPQHHEKHYRQSDKKTTYKTQ